MNTYDCPRCGAEIVWLWTPVGRQIGVLAQDVDADVETDSKGRPLYDWKRHRDHVSNCHSGPTAVLTSTNVSGRIER